MPDLVEVELDDELEPWLQRDPRPRRPWTVRRWGWAATGLAVVLAGVTVAGGVQAASRAVPRSGGLSGDLTVPRQELWSEPDARLVGVVGDLALVTDEQGGTLRALAVGDGTEVWRAVGSCSLTSLDGLSAAQVMGRVAVLSGPERARVVCNGPEQVTRVLDAASGEVLAELPRDFTAVGEYLVHVQTAFSGDGSAVPSGIEVRSAADGSALWSQDLSSSDSTGDWRLAPGALIVVDGSTLRQIDLATGEVHAAPDDGVVPLLEVPLAGGRRAVTGWRASGELAFVVEDVDGQELWSQDSIAAVPAAVRDRAAGAVVLAVSTGGGWSAFDPAGGTALWVDGAATGFPMVHAAGVVVADDGSGPVRDDRTGEVRWTIADTEQALPASDGTTLLLRDEPTGALVVRRLRDGGEVARYPLTGVGQITAVSDALALSEGRLAVITATGLTVVGP